MELKPKKILLAVLDWGLGHASRSTVIAKTLIKQGVDLTIAGAGDALLLLQAELPGLRSIQIPAYQVSYGKGGAFRQMSRQFPHLLQTAIQENKWLKQYAQTEALDGIISDCRFGFYHQQIPSVFISHQLHLPLKSPIVWPAQWVNRWVLRKFQEVWIPDFPPPNSLAGKLSRPLGSLSCHYLGPLSRFQTADQPPKSSEQILILLSGPEPQRSWLEQKILSQIEELDQKVLLVRGLMKSAENKLPSLADHINIVNRMHGSSLEQAIQEASTIICRSGYSTLMDLAAIGSKKILLIPTPEQPEQEYLALHWQEQAWAIYQNQDQLNISQGLQDLAEIKSKTNIPKSNQQQLEHKVETWLQQL